MKTNVFYHGDCLTVLSHDIESQSIDLIYLDPPFFTGKVQKGTLKATAWSPEAIEVSYEDSKSFWSKQGYASNAPVWLQLLGGTRPDFAKYLYYMKLRLQMCHRVLKQTGSIYLHCDEKASHYLKMIMDEIFGWENFRNEIVWCYKGGNASNKFRKKHDIILFYTKSGEYVFNSDAIRIPYSEKIQSVALTDTDGRLYYKTGQNKSGKVYLHPDGQLPYDWWDDISSATASHGSEMLGYPTQKPIKLLERIISASSNEGDLVLDPFCGCGTAVVAAQKLGRKWVGIDASRQAIKATHSRCNQLPDNLGAGLIENSIIDRDLQAVKQLKPLEFEAWVNEYYRAVKPSLDRGVDGITPEGIPIQTKSNLVKYDVLAQFADDIKRHPSVLQPATRAIVASQVGFDDSARSRQRQIKASDGVDMELVIPEDLLNTDVARKVGERAVK